MLRDDLVAAVAGLTTSVANLTARIGAIPPATGGSVSDADVQSAITGIQAASTALDSLVQPPAPPPPQPPASTGPVPAVSNPNQ